MVPGRGGLLVEGERGPYSVLCIRTPSTSAGDGGQRSWPTDEDSCLGGADDEIVKVATDLEASGLVDPAVAFMGSKPAVRISRSTPATRIVVAHVEQDRGLR